MRCVRLEKDLLSGNTEQQTVTVGGISQVGSLVAFSCTMLCDRDMVYRAKIIAIIK